jgi:8-oxo-dGTP pyrophosphatase MutT (NUDIX family)
LITTRTTGCWTVLKGWPIKGFPKQAAARTEVEEEAGLTGKTDKKHVGSFVYWKRLADRFELIDVSVYILPVTGASSPWKEHARRRL